MRPRWGKHTLYGSRFQAAGDEALGLVSLRIASAMAWRCSWTSLLMGIPASSIVFTSFGFARSPMVSIAAST